MATAKASPAKGKATRRWFTMRDTSNQLITGAWTAPNCNVYVDGVLDAVVHPAVTQIAGTGIGYVDLTDAQMNGDAIAVVVTVTNAGNTAFSEIIYTRDFTLVNSYPTSETQMLSQLHARFFNRHETGAQLWVYDRDGTTIMFRADLQSSPVGVKAFF